MKTIKDLKAYRPSIISTSNIKSDATFKDFVSENSIQLNEWFYEEFGDITLKKKFRIEVNDFMDLIPLDSIVTSYLYVNNNNLERMYQAYISEYNPIDNYDKTSTITTEYQGDKTTTIQNGTITNTIGSRTDTNVEQTSLVDDNNFTDKYKSTVSGGEQTNTTSKTNDSSTESFNNRKDTVTEKTSGNIGVTTSTTMLKEHTDFWSHFNFCNELANVILNALTEGVWDNDY